MWLLGYECGVPEGGICPAFRSEMNRLMALEGVGSFFDLKRSVRTVNTHRVT